MKNGAALIIVAALVFLAPGCGGGGSQSSGGGQGTFPKGAKGHMVLKFEVQTTAANYQQIKAGYSQKILADGETLDDANHAIAAAPVPLPGHWVKIGQTLAMADSSGNFTLPAGASGPNIELLRDPGDAKPQATFPISALDASGSASNPLVLNVIFQGPAEMDLSNKPPASVGHCAPGKTPSLILERCLDWDGPLGDHIPHDQSTAQGVLGYIKSTCWKNVDSGLCYNEGNTITNQVTSTAGPRCWMNHKYRMCQSVVQGDFHFSDTQNGIVIPGNTVGLTIENNTAGNESTLRLTGPGMLVDTKYGDSGATIIVKHYDDSSQKHLITRVVQYVSDPTVMSGIVTITARTDGHTVTDTLEISTVAGAYTGVFGGNDTAGDNISGTFAIKVSTTGVVSGTAIWGPAVFDVSGSVDLATGVVKFGTATLASINATYIGNFVNIKGKASAKGTWTSINTRSGVTGSGSWSTS